jgi:hypothetical protein
MSLPFEVHYQLRQLAKPIAAEVAASAPNRRAWVTVNPVVPSEIAGRYRPVNTYSERAQLVFAVIRFEVDEDDYAQSRNTDDDWICIARNKTELILISDEALEQQLLIWVQDLNSLQQAWKVDVPPYQ